MEIVKDVPVWIWPAILGVILLLAEIYMMFRYRRLLEDAKKGPVIIPLIFKGSISPEIDLRASELLRYELDNIAKVFSKMRDKFGFLDVPIEVGNELSTMMALSSASLNLDPLEHPNDFKLLDKPPDHLLKKINIKTKWFEAPLSALTDLIILFLKNIPVPYKRRALNKLIYVSYELSGDVYNITVYKREKKGGKKEEIDKPKSKITDHVAVDKGESELFKVAAFMILELNGEVFKGLKWRGMFYFTRGLEQLIQFLRKPEQELLENAKIAFREAINADACEYEACCFLGALLVAERKEVPIKEAITIFERALETKRPKFKAFVHAGLAHCYAQQYHRLAKRDINVVLKAREQAKLAATIWKNETSEIQPWIQYTQALTIVIDEGINNKTPEEFKNQFIPAMNLCLEAIGKGEGNKLFYNTLAWMLLKLAENDIIELTAEDGISEKLKGNVPELAEVYFKKSLQYYRKNKLSHANLCLLYATPYFLRKSEKSATPGKYLIKCRVNGIKAIQIDPDYINGYRDLTVSLIRYRKFDEAYKYYELALEKATYEDKDLEIMGDVREVLVQTEASDDILKKYDNPPAELLVPPEQKK